jgi:hypothetical protein
MRGVSQTRHIKVTEVARTIIKAHRSGSGPRPKDTSRPADASGPGNASRPANTSRLADALQPAEHGAAGPAGQAAAGAVRGSDPS